MSLEKAIRYGKEHRKPYPKNDSRNFVWSCRNNKSCEHCRTNRTFDKIKKALYAQDEVNNN